MTEIDTQASNSLEQNVIGNHLQHLRQEKGLSITEIADVTKITPKNIQAIESQDYDNLPADTFTRGQITIYGDFLGIDGRQVAARFIAERNAGRKKNRYAKKTFAGYKMEPKKLAEPSHIPPLTVAGLLLLVIVLSFAIFCFYTSWNPFAFLTGKTKSLSSNMFESSHSGEQQNNDLATEAPFELKVHFLQDTEIILAVDGQEPVHRSFKKDENITWTAGEVMQLEFRQPESASLVLNNRPIPFPQDQEGQFIVRLGKSTNDQ